MHLALNEFAILTKKQNEVNDEMNKTTEELRKARIELSEFETTRLPNREYEIKQKKDNIQELEEKIKYS